jgi:hypothetical protein
MSTTPQWKSDFEDELRKAEAARLAGNEGMARVCARRAAGIVVGEYLRRRGIEFSDPSAYERLKLLSELPGVPPSAQELARHFLVRITPQGLLPIEADLIAEARLLAQELLR